MNLLSECRCDRSGIEEVKVGMVIVAALEIGGLGLGYCIVDDWRVRERREIKVCLGRRGIYRLGPCN